MRTSRLVLATVVTLAAAGLASPPAWAGLPLASPTCTKTYSAGGGDWSVGASWSPSGVPTSSDVACWAAGDTVTVSGGSNLVRAIGAGGTLSITGGALGVVSNPGDVGSLTGLSMIGTGPSAWGTLNANASASLSVAGPITLNGGTIQNIAIDQTSGAFSIGGTGTTNGAPFMSGPVITTTGPISLTNTSFSAINSTSITTTGTFSVPAGYATAGGSGTTINTAGLVTGGGTVTLSGIAVNLTGSASSVTGTVNVASITSSPTGSLTLASPATIVTNSSPGGTPTWAGTLDGAGTLAVDYGTLRFAAGSAVTGVTVLVGATGAHSGAVDIGSDGFSPGALVITAGDTTVLAGIAASAGALTMTSPTPTTRGTLTGDGIGSGSASLTVNGDVTLANGVIHNLIVNQTGSHSLTIDGGGTGTGRPELTSVLYTASDPGATATFTNASFSASSSTITTGGTTTFAASYANDAGSSDSHLRAGSFVTAGGSDIAAPALTGFDMTITGGTTTLRAGTSTPGDWFVEPGATLAGTGGVAGRVTNQGGTVSPGGSGSVGAMTFANGYTQTSGTLQVDAASPSSSDQLDQSGGQAPAISGGTIAVNAIGGFLPTPSYDATIIDGSGSSGSATTVGVTVTDSLAGRHLVASAVGQNVHLTLGTAVPDAPGIHAVAGDAQITLTLTAPGSDGGLPIDLYTVTCSPDCGPAAPAQAPGATSFAVASTATPVVLTGLRNGTAYTFTISAHNGDGNGAAGAPAIATPTHKPVGLATAVPATIVITGSTAKITIRCTTDVSIPIKACSITARDARNRVVATGTRSGAAAVITVVAKLNATGIKDAAGSGGAAITVMASITPASGAKLSATTTLTVTKKTTTITLVSDILFGSGSATLKPAGVKALRKIAQQLRGAKQITCVGHTDADGSAAANQALGLARAKAVCALLKLPGSKTRFITKSKGATQPVAPNTTPANKAKNRRVEIKIVNG